MITVNFSLKSGSKMSVQIQADDFIQWVSSLDMNGYLTVKHMSDKGATIINLREVETMVSN